MTSADANPLLQPSSLPNQAPPFARIAEDHYFPAVEVGILEARAKIDAIKSNKDKPDFENTVVALETASETLRHAAGIFYNMLSQAGTDGLHALAEKIGPVQASFISDIMLDDALFARIKAVYDQRAGLTLSTEQKTLLEETYKMFVRSGALLDDAKKARLREVDQRLSVLGPLFMNNVTKSAEAFELVIDDPADLSGLPKSAIDGARQAAEDKKYDGKWLFTLEFPSFGPFIQFSDRRDLREKMWRAFGSRAFNDSHDNSATVLEIARLRHERAQILGYKTHAAFTLEERMASTPSEVVSFLEKLKGAYKPAALKELKQLQDFARDMGATEALQPWDIAYYSEKMKQKLFNFSSEDIRPYFPIDTVLKGCFTHFSRLFNLRFEQNDKYETWHQDVKTFDVFDTNDNSFVGTLYTDFFPRTGKKDGAWMTDLRSQGLYRGKVERPVIAIVCNFTKPTAKEPSRLTHNEVLTLFHEMGHALHGLLSRVTYPSLAGTNVKWDFVELPSQVQENWAYTRETLNMIGAHFETGEKIPDDLIRKLDESKNYMVGWAGLRQVNFGFLDMAWHNADPSSITDVGAFEDKATADTSLFPRMAGPASVAFSHLFSGGYSAGYYSYKWAEVLDADAFELFEQKGLYDPKTAESYKREVLSKGGSEHPRVLYHRFRGRDADPDALLRREGIAGGPK